MSLVLEVGAIHGFRGADRAYFLPPKQRTNPQRSFSHDSSWRLLKDGVFDTLTLVQTLYGPFSNLPCLSQMGQSHYRLEKAAYWISWSQCVPTKPDMFSKSKLESQEMQMTTSKKVASKASKELRNPKTKPSQRSVAASDLSQAKSAKKTSKGKKK